MPTGSAATWSRWCATPRKLTAADRAAIAAYIKSLPAVEGLEASAEEIMPRRDSAAMPGYVSPAMNLFKAIGLKLLSALLFAAMSALVRQLGDVVPVGQIVFFRSACAILPVVVIYAYRGELASAVYTSRPFGQLGRGALSVGGMFTNFSALARLPLADATAISFASPLITVALGGDRSERARAHLSLDAVLVGFAA